MGVTSIDDPDDRRLADYRNIPDPELVARRGLFVAEGRLVVARLLRESRMGVRSVLVTDTARVALGGALDGRADVPVYVVPQQVMNGIAGYNVHRGCLALGERPASSDWRPLARGARRLLVLERVGNVDNIGALFRNCAAFGGDGVLLDPACADPLYRKAIRTSMGAALVVPFARVEPLPAALCDLRAMGHAVVGMTPSAEAMPLRDAAVAIGDRAVAVVLGHEGEGLLPDTRARCEHLVRIPMPGDTDSLNVATAGAIALYELTRG